MRVLLVSQFYPPVIGGVEFHVREIARGLAERGHVVGVATLAGRQEARREIEDGVDVWRLSGTTQSIGALHATERRHAPPIPDPKTYAAMRRVVGEFRPEIVHAHNWMGRSFVPLKRTSQAKYVVTLHDCSITCVQGRMMRRGLTPCEGPTPRRCLGCAGHVYGASKGTATYLGNRLMQGAERRAVDAFIPVSSAVAEATMLSATGVPYEVIPNFTAELGDDSAASDERLQMLPSDPFILQVGDVVSDKGVDVLLEAYAEMQSGPRLVLIGRASRERLAGRPQRVTMTGMWPRELVGEAWRRSLFGTMPSLCLDASPTVTLEAMSAGKAVIASSRGGLTDQVVDGVTGFLVPPGDRSALRDAMTRLADDASLRERMGSAARERFETTFAAPVVIDRIEALYRSTIAADA
jgi:glycosyltransferase involved in cell wall biosynthesis